MRTFPASGCRFAALAVACLWSCSDFLASASPCTESVEACPAHLFYAFLPFTTVLAVANPAMPSFRLLLLVLFSGLSWAVAQSLTGPMPTPAGRRNEGYQLRQKIDQQSLVSLNLRNIGPTLMSGRVTDLDVDPANPNRFYTAYASGGLWLTENNGQSFRPLFDQEAVMTIGDIAVGWQHGETIWIGTGEQNSSRSSYSGNGIYKSIDKGKTWQHLGLNETHHIGKIILHPENSNIVWVAAMGHLFSANADRGVYKTTDGGKTWRKTLFINDSTGIIDLVTDPQNPQVLYAAAWERHRWGWDFKEDGAASGIYRSVDGGEKWTRITQTGSGFPAGVTVGRIGLAMFHAPKTAAVLYAVLDNQARRTGPKKDDGSPALTVERLTRITTEAFLDLPDDTLNYFLDWHRFPKEHTAITLKAAVKKGTLKPNDVARFLRDANSDLFDTPVTGAEVYASYDEGKTWQKTHTGYLDGVFNSYGYYFAQIRVNPGNPKEVYILGVPILRSGDGGKTFTSINEPNVHVDHHALWINPANPNHLVVGCDGGVHISYDAGKHYVRCNPIPVAQCYAVGYDMATPFNIYVGLQDNGVWKGASNSRINDGWQMDGDHPWKELMGGDGMQIQVDNRDKQIIYTGYQFGNYTRIEPGKRATVKPKHLLGEDPLRFCWQSPILLSRHNPDILYFGTHKLHRSMDQGNTFKAISGDLTQGERKGNVPFGTLTTISESPMTFGLLYTGSDDGLVHVSRDGGVTWQNISAGLPRNLRVSRVEASKYKEGRVYVSLNGHTWDHFDAHLFVSEDFGKTWKPLGNGLPVEPVNVVREDPVNENLLYVGTDGGLYLSWNQGDAFMGVGCDSFPKVAVHDLAIHPRDKKLIVGTHGRSVFVAPVGPLQSLNDSLRAMPLALFATADSLPWSGDWGARGYEGKFEAGPELLVPVWLNKGDSLKITLVRASDSLLVYSGKQLFRAGLGTWRYDLTWDGKAAPQLREGLPPHERYRVQAADNGRWYLPHGKYHIRFEANGMRKELLFTVKKPENKEARIK